MLKKTIKYTDYNGNEIIEDFYFNLNEAEITEMELGINGGMSELLEKIINTHDVPNIIKYFKEIVLRSYGVKSPDGKQFMKSKELSTAFSQTEAYNQLFMELFSGDNAAKATAEFVNGVMPKQVLANMKKQEQAKLEVVETAD